MAATVPRCPPLYRFASSAISFAFIALVNVGPLVMFVRFAHGLRPPSPPPRTVAQRAAPQKTCSSCLSARPRVLPVGAFLFRGSGKSPATPAQKAPPPPGEGGCPFRYGHGLSWRRELRLKNKAQPRRAFGAELAVSRAEI